MKIEVRVIPTGDFGLFLDGRRLGTNKSVYLGRSAPADSVSIFNRRLSEKLLPLAPSDFPEEIQRIKLFYPVDDTLISDFEFHRIDNSWDTWVELNFDGENWKNRWSITEYGDCAIELGASESKEVSHDSEFYGNNFSIQIITDQKGSFETLIKHAIKEWKEFHARVVSELEHAVVIEFEFAPEIRVPCEQYLQYFGQFLQDLGVASDTSVRHEGKLTILSSSPQDKRDALQKIRQALDIYLKLSATSHPLDGASPIAAHQFLANIQHLQGQLSLAQAMIETKNATIAAQTNSLLLAHSVLAGVRLSKPDSEEPTEPLLGGIVTLGKTEPKYGLSVSWAELFRRLRAYFKR